MARGTQFIQLVTMLRAELGQSVDPAVGVETLAGHRQTIRRVQEQLYDDYDWPFLRVIEGIKLQAGQRFYDLPVPINLERVERMVAVRGGTSWPIERGIGFSHYDAVDSEAGERADPPRAWDVRRRGPAEQIEVWPIPAGDGGGLRIRGLRRLAPLLADEDRADLDDLLIVLYAASELLARQGSGDAQQKLAAAQSRYARLKGRSRGGSSPIAIGSGNAAEAPRRQPIRIRP